MSCKLWSFHRRILNMCQPQMAMVQLKITTFIWMALQMRAQIDTVSAQRIHIQRTMRTRIWVDAVWYHRRQSPNTNRSLWKTITWRVQVQMLDRTWRRRRQMHAMMHFQRIDPSIVILKRIVVSLQRICSAMMRPISWWKQHYYLRTNPYIPLCMIIWTKYHRQRNDCRAQRPRW